MADTAKAKIDDWVATSYAATPTAVAPTGNASSGNTGMLAAASSASAPAAAAPAAAAPAASATSTASSAKPDVANWYRTTLGRDGDAGGIAFWQKAIDGGMDANEAFSMFQQSAKTNKEAIKTGTSWDAVYNGPQSSNSRSVVDDWGKNVLGRALTGAEQVQWDKALSGAKTAEESQAVYAKFLQAMGGQVRNNLDLAGASQINAGSTQYQPVLIDKDDLTQRVIDPKTETVAGQLKTLLDENSPVLQKARADAMLAAADRGMLNSAMAASGGTAAVIDAATGIATTDSGYYNRASDYNAAAANQALQLNQAAQNNHLSQSQQIEAQAALADKNNAFQSGQTDKNNAFQADQQKNQLAQQMTIAQIQDATSRWQTEQNTANSRYNTDQAYKKDVDNQKLGVANNIIQNMDLSPDRKAAMLEQLGFGTMAKPGIPGSGLAGAVFVLDSVGAELGSGGSGSGGNSGLVAGAIGNGKNWPNGHTIPSWAVPSSPDYDGQRVAQYWASAVVN